MHSVRFWLYTYGTLHVEYWIIVYLLVRNIGHMKSNVGFAVEILNISYNTKFIVKKVTLFVDIWIIHNCMHANDGHPHTTELFNGINSVLTHLTHHSMFGIIKSTNLL